MVSKVTLVLVGSKLHFYLFSSKFGVAVHFITESIAERTTSYPCTSRTCPHTNDEIPQAECCWEKTGKSLLSLNVSNTDNRLKHDR